MSLTLSFDTQGEILIAKILGRMDAFGTNTAESAFSSAPLPSARKLILDCSGMTYLSSAGVRLIISLQKQLSASGQDLALCSIQPFCHGVLEMSGLTGLIPTFNSVSEALSVGPETTLLVENNHGAFTFHHSDSTHATIDIMGDIANILDCSITGASIAGKPFFETEYSLGAGAMGGEPDDYLPVIGEAIMVAGTLVWLPTDGHDTPDYMIPRKASTKVVLQTAFNASLRGGFNDFVHFTASADKPAAIRDIYRTIFETAAQRHPNYLGVIGLAMRAEIADAYGAGLTRSPLLANRPSNGLPVTAPENFSEWFESDKTPRNQNTTALICGAGADLTRDLSGIDQDRLRRMFYVNPANVGQQTESLHNHAVFFTEAPDLLNQKDMDVEMRHVVDHARFVDMRHLLDQTTIRSAVIAVSYVQEVREDKLR